MSGADALLTVTLGAEHDAELRAAVGRVLRRLGAEGDAATLAVAGSQEIETWAVTVQGATLTLEAETYEGLSATGPTWLVQRLQAFLHEERPPSAPAAGSRPRWVRVGLRPACALPTADGGYTVLAYDWATGALAPEPGWLPVVLGLTDKDVDELTEAEFEADLARLRAGR